MAVSKLELEWRLWRLREGRYKGYTGTRPAHFPKTVPAAWWLRLAAFLALRKKPVKPDPLRFWRSTGAFEGWGLGNGQFSPNELAVIAKNRGLKWVAVQDSPSDRSKRDALKAAFAFHGLKLVVWETRPITISSTRDCLSYWQPDGYVAEVETRSQSDGWNSYAEVIRRENPSLPLGIITNFWGAGGSNEGYDRSEAERWWRNDWACITEAYVWNEEGHQPGLQPHMLDWTAKTHLGFPETFPSFGIYRALPTAYAQYLEEWPNHSWYLAEYFPEAR